MTNYTEPCPIDDWSVCQQTPCQFHGTCHDEAMMLPEDGSEDRNTSGMSIDRDYASKYAYACGYFD